MLPFPGATYTLARACKSHCPIGSWFSLFFLEGEGSWQSFGFICHRWRKISKRETMEQDVLTAKNGFRPSPALAGALWGHQSAEAHTCRRNQTHARMVMLSKDIKVNNKVCSPTFWCCPCTAFPHPSTYSISPTYPGPSTVSLRWLGPWIRSLRVTLSPALRSDRLSSSQVFGWCVALEGCTWVSVLMEFIKH